MQTYRIQKNGYMSDVRTSNIDNLRKSQMTKAHMTPSLLIWVWKGDELMGQIRYSMRHGFLWYRSKEQVNTINRNGRIGRDVPDYRMD